MRDTRPDYPPEYDDECELCEVCGRDEMECVCPVCPRCNCCGDPDCYTNGHLPKRDESMPATVGATNEEKR